MNTVCLIAVFKRNPTNDNTKAEVLQQVLSEYFGKTNLSRFLYGKKNLGELSLAEVSVLFQNLEQEFNTNLKSSYMEFLHVVINEAGIGRPFYHKGFLNLNPVLATLYLVASCPTKSSSNCSN